MAETLFSEQATNATSSTFELTVPRGAIAVSGTFDGATVAVHMSIDETVYTSVESFTEAGLKVYQFIKRGQVRVVLSGAGASTSLTVKIEQER